MASHDDGQQNFALGLIATLVLLVILFVVGIGIQTSRSFARLAAAEVAAAPATGTLAVLTETVTVVIPEGASIQVVDGVVSFYFATNSADLAPGAAEALATVIKGVEEGRSAQISGFHDTTGDAAVNDKLAQLRAQTVRDVLVGLGVPADKISLKKPEVSTGSGNDAQARRVEVTLVD